MPEPANLVQEMASKLKSPDTFAEAVIDLCYFLEGEGNGASHAHVFLPAIVETLEKTDCPFDMEKLAVVCAAFGRAAVPHLITLTKSPRAVVREAAALGLRKLGKDADVAAEALTILLSKDREAAVRAQACRGLVAARPDRASALLLAKCLEDPSEPVVEAAIESLGEIGPAVSELAVPELVRFLDPGAYKTSETCFLALKALTNMKVDAGYLKHFRRLLERDWEKLHKESYLLPFMELRLVVPILGRMGSAAREDVPVLERLIRIDDEVIFYATKIDAAFALLRIDPDNTPAVKAITRFAASGESTHRRCIVDGLEEATKTIQAQLIEVIKKLSCDSDEEVQASAKALLECVRNKD
jgi:HEAT repeats